MIRHHPDLNLLVEYASGSLPWSAQLATAAHISFCSKCRETYGSLSALGGVALTHSQPAQVSDDCYDKLLTRISDDGESSSAEEAWQAETEDMEKLRKKTRRLRLSDSTPAIIQKLLPDEPQLTWKWVSAGLRSARLNAEQAGYEVALHRISKGSRVVEHDHKGIEYTLVLEGSFSDDRGVYRKGDFVVNRPGDIHKPTATQDQDCLCLSVCEAPVQVTGFVGKVINPFFKARPF